MNTNEFSDQLSNYRFPKNASALLAPASCVCACFASVGIGG